MPGEGGADKSSILNKRISRREALLGAGIVAEGVALNALTGNPVTKAGESLFSRIGSLIHPKPEFVPVPDGDIAEILYPYGHENSPLAVRVALNNEGLPVKYILPDGKEIPFDLNLVTKTKDQAVSSGESEIINLINIPKEQAKPREKTFDPYTPTPEHPKVDNLPGDVLSEEALKGKGIQIIQAPDTQLYIREGAFSKGAPLEAFANGNRKFNIVLVDGTVVARTLLDDERYKDVRDLLGNNPQAIEGFRQKEIKEAQENINKIRERIKKYPQEIPDPKHPSAIYAMNLFMDELLEAKSLLLQNQKKIIPDDLIQTEIIAQATEGGLYAPANGDRPATVFIAVGESGSQPDVEVINFYFDQEGKFNFNQLDKVGRHIRTGGGHYQLSSYPRPFETHPNPDDFQINPNATPDNPKSYPYGVQSAGQALQHEIAHDNLITGSNNWSEYDTDTLAMSRIREAWNKWRDSGFTDDSGYHFVFKLPSGGYILTKEKGSRSAPSSA